MSGLTRQKKDKFIVTRADFIKFILVNTCLRDCVGSVISRCSLLRKPAKDYSDIFNENFQDVRLLRIFKEAPFFDI
jgi:hypothetical protein